ncbi:MAG: LuxR C-terminal-related transcriptional regulator, partial [Nitriliruptoraceae bacterium]
LAADRIDAAAAGVDKLEKTAADFGSTFLEAIATEGRGMVLLAAGDPARAAEKLRLAWQALDAPYESARIRVALARTFQELGDDAAAEIELDAASEVFTRVKAAPALAQADTLSRRTGRARPGGLTPREAEVLQLVATGASNQDVADTLVISEKTVARHLSNIFVKLGVGSRAAATAWAYENDLP